MKLSRATIDRLQHIQVSDPDVDIGRFPTFLLAGPQRTGSTWIHKQLEPHPQVSVSEPKELYFLNTVGRPKHRQHWSDDLVDYLAVFREDDAARRTRDEQCRKAFGEPYEPTAIGEATASYAAGMDESRIADLLLIQPDIKVIIIVRDPVERAWSHAKLMLSQLPKRRVADVREDEFEKFLGNEYVLRCGLYTDFIARWQTMLRPGHLLYRDFDEIRERPVELLQEILRFLGVRADARYVSRGLGRGRNSTEPSSGVPSPFRERLVDHYRDQIDAIRGTLGLGERWVH